MLSYLWFVGILAGSFPSLLMLASCKIRQYARMRLTLFISRKHRRSHAFGRG